MAKATFYVLSENADAAISAARSVPGVYASKRDPRMLFCSDHAAWIVERLLLHANVRFRLHADRPEEILSEFPQIPELLIAPDFFLPHQREFVQRFAHRAGCYAFHAAGAGKTLAAIAWTLLTPGLVLVVTRASVKTMWAAEIARFSTASVLVVPRAIARLLAAGAALQEDAVCRNVPVLALTDGQRIDATTTLAQIAAGSSPARVVTTIGKAITLRTVRLERTRAGYRVIEAASEEAPLPRFLVTNWEALQRSLGILRALPIQTVIWDEIHKGKQPKRAIALYGPGDSISFTSRENVSSAASTIAKLAKRRVGLSATPVADRLRDLWAQLDLIEPFQWGSFGGPSKPGWSGRYCGACASKYTTWNTTGIGTPEMVNELRQRLWFVMHAVPREVTHANLPPKRRIVTRIDAEDLDPPPDELLKELKRVARDQPTRLREVRLALASARKRSFALDLIAAALESGQKVVAFTARVRDCRLLADAVRALVGRARRERRIPVWSGSGETPLSERERMRAEYMAREGAGILIGTGEAFGESISLHDTDLVLFVMTPINARQLKQWEGRFTRVSQKRPVIIQYLIAEGTADVPVADILLSKLPAVESVLADAEMGAAAKEIRFGGKEEEIEAALFKALTKEERDDR